jgi:hypothetical protein
MEQEIKINSYQLVKLIELLSVYIRIFPEDNDALSLRKYFEDGLLKL